MSEALALLGRLASSRDALADGLVFWLHHRLSASVLVAACGLLAAGQYMGDPITCTAVEGIAPSILDTYCWVQATFTVPTLVDGVVGRDVAQAGVGPQGAGDAARYHGYYQFVSFFLAAQAGLMYFPRFLWKLLDVGVTRRLVQLSAEGRREAVVALLLSRRPALWLHAAAYGGCEALNLVLVLAQLFAADAFLGGGFLGLQRLELVFPKVAKCTLHTVGPSGSPQRHDSLCLLPLNAYAEKIYVALWFWYWALVALSAANLLLRALTALAPPLRTPLLATLCLFHCGDAAAVVSRGLAFPQWFVLCDLSGHVDADTYVSLVREMAHILSHKD